MIDIVEIPDDGRDLQVADTSVPKAANIVSVQLGTLEYAQDFGVDLEYFLQSQFIFQNASFKSYIVQRLAESDVNISEVQERIEALFSKNTFNIDDNDPQSQKGGLIL